MRQSLVGAAGLALAAVLVLCVVAPPEIRGSGQAAVALFVVVAVAASSAKEAGSPASRWVFAAVPLGLVAIRTALAPGEAVEPAACLLLAVFAGIAAAQVGEHEHDESLARLLAVLVAFAGVRALYETIFGLAALADRVRASAPAGDVNAVLNRLEQGRPYAGFLTPAALGCFFIMTIPAVAAWALSKRGGARALGLAAASLGALGLVMTRSVSALAAFACALALAGLRQRVAPRLLAMAAGAIVIAVVFAGLLRSDAVFAPTRDDSPWRLRAGNVRIALQIAHEHPFAGVGPGGYAEAFPQYRREGDNESHHAHDLPAELVAEWGVPVGFVLSALFFWVFVGPLLKGDGDPRTLSSGLTIGVAAFALHNLADFTAFLPSLFVFAAIGRGVLEKRATRDAASVPARAAWIALAAAVAVVSAGSGLSRDALFYAREAATSGDHARAFALAARAARLAPWDADPPQLAAEARMALGTAEPGASLEDADRAVGRAPARAGARLTRARARSALGDSTGAYADLVEAARLNPLRSEYALQRDALAAALLKASEAAPR